MALYTYRCEVDGPADVAHPIGTAPATVPCPACGGTSTRVITAPRLGLADLARVGLIDRTTASAHEPTVVASVPRRPGGRRAPAPHPATRALPRP